VGTEEGMSAAIFASEAELCAAFISQIPATWVAYPETGGFDIMLARRSDGVQIGIEAKLKLNAKVIEQIAPASHWYGRDEQPDYRAILVPWGCSGSLSGICKLLALTVIRMKSKAIYLEDRRWNRAATKFDPSLPDQGEWWHWREEWHDWCPDRRVTLPDYVPDVIAGASAPLALTEWKVKAIKIAIVLERRGYVTRADFKALKIDSSRWINGGWLDRGAARGQYVAGRYTPDFRKQHPINYGQIEADFAKWDPDTAKDLL